MAILFTSPASCDFCRPRYVAFTQAATNPAIAAIVVGWDDAGTLAGFLSEHPTRVPVVPDPDLIVAGAWGVNQYSALVLIDADGAVVDVVELQARRRAWPASLSALIAGGPIPTEEPSSAPSPPGATLAPCTETQVLCLPDGAQLAPWTGHTLAGAEISSEDLRGRPAVMWLENPAMCDGSCPVDWVEAGLIAEADLAARLGDRASFLVLVTAEEEAGRHRPDPARVGR